MTYNGIKVFMRYSLGFYGVQWSLGIDGVQGIKVFIVYSFGIDDVQ